MRSGIYIVATSHWYIERTVWLIAGFVLLISTALALLVNPWWILGVITTGLVSINVALTGFCPVGNVLQRLGFKPMLGRPNDGRWYFLQIDSWYLERRIYVTVGVNIILGSILFLTHSPWWGAFTTFVGAAMIWFAATGYCVLANLLYWIGTEPRLNPGQQKRYVPQHEPSARCGQCAMAGVCVSNPRATPGSTTGMVGPALRSATWP